MNVFFLRPKLASKPNIFQCRSFSTVSISKDTPIGFVGTGVMGRWMCEHLIDNGWKNCTVYNRTKSKTEPLRVKGATVANSPYEVGQRSQVVFTIVGFPHDVQSVILGKDKEKGILDGLQKGSIIVDMTTSKPQLAQHIFQEAKEREFHSLDAPVSGGDVGAREARLSIMVGGDKQVFDTVSPLFAAMGKNIRYMGPAGAGQHTKMTNQILISTTMIGLVEGLLYAYKAGLDLNEVIAASFDSFLQVGAGAAGSWSLNNYGPRIVARNFDPGFFVDHFVKDMEIALEEAKSLDLKLPGLQLALQLYKELQKLGHGKKGTHALMLALENMNKCEIPPRK